MASRKRKCLVTATKSQPSAVYTPSELLPSLDLLRAKVTTSVYYTKDQHRLHHIQSNLSTSNELI